MPLPKFKPPQKPREDPAVALPRLQATLAELQAKRNELVLSLLPYIPDDEPDKSDASVKVSSKSIPEDTGTTSKGTMPHPPTASSTSPSTVAGQTIPQKRASEDVHSQPQEEPTEEQIAAVLQLAKENQKAHIAALHGYNEIKDVAQGLMGLLAEQRGVRVIEVMEEFGVDAKD